jgi:hypothetical protein
MRGWEMPAADATYRALKNYVATAGGTRLRLHAPLRDRLVEMVVEEWPDEFCPVDRIGEVVTARIRLRLRERYGSVVAMFIISTLVNAIVKLVIDWWLKRESHRVLMYGWSRQAG